MKDIASILSKVDAEGMLTKEDAVTLLNIDNQSKVFYELIAKANELSRKEYGDKGYIFAQIGLNSEPCLLYTSHRSKYSIPKYSFD